MILELTGILAEKHIHNSKFCLYSESLKVTIFKSTSLKDATATLELFCMDDSYFITVFKRT